MTFIEDIKEIFQYKEMLFSLVKRDLRGRYKGSILGFLWTLILPIAQLLVYTVVFSVIFPTQIENFPVFIFIGLLPWNFLTNILNFSTNIIVGNANLVKKIYFPRAILPIAVIATYLFDFICSLIILLPTIIVFGIPLSLNILWFPIILFVQTIFVTGLALFLSAAYVKVRDLQYIVNLGTMVWFYLTPIVYSTNMLTPNLKMLISLNPMTGIIDSYRNILMYQLPPEASSLLITIVVSLMMLIIGTIVFRRGNKTFAEEL